MLGPLTVRMSEVVYIWLGCGFGGRVYQPSSAVFAVIGDLQLGIGNFFIAVDWMS